MGIIKKWKVKSYTSDDKYYTVSMDSEGNYSCSCPCWIYKRKDCKHIDEVKLKGGIEVPKAEYVLAKVNEPKLKDGAMIIPLVAIGDWHMEATIDYFMLKNGWSMADIIKIRHLSGDFSVRSIKEIIDKLGPKKYPKDWCKCS